MTEGARYAALIRHGAYHQQAGAPSARQPHPLTDEGQAQARTCADLLAGLLDVHGLTLDPVVHCSMQLRAWQTATGIADRLAALGLQVDEVRETRALAERGLGSAANLTVAQIEAVLATDPRHDPPPPGWKSDSDYRLPLDGAESLMEAGARVAAHLRETMAAASPARLTVFVGHGASFRHAAHHLGLMSRDDIRRLSMFHARPLLVCYTPRDSWRHFAGSWKVRPRSEEPAD